MANKEVDSRNPYSPKIIEGSAFVGYGEKQKLVVKVSKISPPSPPIFRVVDVDTKVVITNTKLIPPPKYSYKGKVIVDGYVDKNVLYKTIDDSTCDSVNGQVYQFTTRLDFATFVDVIANEPFGKNAQVQILKAFVEGSKEEPIDKNPPAAGGPDWAVTYNKLLEKIIVKIELKITKEVYFPVYAYGSQQPASLINGSGASGEIPAINDPNVPAPSEPKADSNPTAK